jgi:hypothetical protein
MAPCRGAAAGCSGAGGALVLFAPSGCFRARAFGAAAGFLVRTARLTGAARGGPCSSPGVTGALESVRLLTLGRRLVVLRGVGVSFFVLGFFSSDIVERNHILSSRSGAGR